MGGLMKPGEGDLANTANYLASKVGGAINGTYDFPGMITNGFTLPQYGGNLGVGVTDNQSQLLNLGNALLGRYFGGGYGSGAGINGGQVPQIPQGPGDLQPGIPDFPRQLPPTSGGGGIGIPQTPSFPISPGGGQISLMGAPVGSFNPGGFNPASPGNFLPTTSPMFDPATGTLSPGAGGQLPSLPPGVVGTLPGLSPSGPNIDQRPDNAMQTPPQPTDRQTFFDGRAANFNPQFGSSIPGVSPMGNTVFGNNPQTVPGSQNIFSQIATMAGRNPGQFDPTVMGLINNPAVSSLLGLSQGQGVGGQALQGLLQGPGQQFGQIADVLNRQRLDNQAVRNRDIREQMSVSGLRGSTNYADALARSDTESENNMMAELARLVPTITGQDISSKQAGLGALTQAAGTAAGAGSQGANTLANLFQSGQGNSLQAALASPGALQLLSQLPYQLAGAQQGLASGDLGLLGNLYGMNEQGRLAQDTNAVRGLQEYQRTQSLFPQLLGFLSGTQPMAQASPFQQATGAASQAGSLALMSKALK